MIIGAASGRYRSGAGTAVPVAFLAESIGVCWHSFQVERLGRLGGRMCVSLPPRQGRRISWTVLDGRRGRDRRNCVTRPCSPPTADHGFSEELGGHGRDGHGQRARGSGRGHSQRRPSRRWQVRRHERARRVGHPFPASSPGGTRPWPRGRAKAGSRRPTSHWKHVGNTSALAPGAERHLPKSRPGLRRSQRFCIGKADSR